VRPNLERLADAARWWNIVAGPFTGAIADKELCARAAELLPAEPWGEATWHDWTESLKAATGKGGKALYQPLRLALTGLGHGPEMKSLLPLIGASRAKKLLRGETVA
jgi:glutamyl-tRNA synthetase